ncbi:uncharacterized protein LOC131672731 [Phymastichus coffea]|uniref:uncharacterized protein LOC131672731 n=1 Tax=Phymastichus coffea TaxID=108790 RepID=UPI00273ABF1C|nr:uncharacterized protein LOC131672731 [Phymastichus coffea]
MARSSVNFPLILSVLLLLPFRVVSAVHSRESTDVSPQLCIFDEDNRTYNATDLLLCLNEQARNIVFHQNTNSTRITDRAYQDARQSYSAYPFAPAYSIPAASAVAATSPPTYFGSEMLSQLLSGRFKLSSLSNFLDFSGLTRPGFKFFKALSSIAQYDDLKCVPRILCEVASGSMPGSLTYRPSSDFQNFGIGSSILSGSNVLFGLLTAFDTSGTSPILSFGRAALLGYTNRGQPHICYREYSRCPQDSHQLISYLNNYHGGFFQFFNGNTGAYYPQQQYNYRPRNYYKNSNVKKQQFPASQIFSEAGAEQDGSESLQFDNLNYYHQQSSKPDFFTMQVRENGPSKVLFPKDKRENRFLSNYFNRQSVDSLNRLTSYNFQKKSIRKDRKLLPVASDNYGDYPITANQIDENRMLRVKKLENENRFSASSNGKPSYLLCVRKLIELMGLWIDETEKGLISHDLNLLSSMGTLL